jgi:hypothetical protein
MKVSILIAAGAALTLAACDARSDAAERRSARDRGDPLRVVDRLDCPDQQGRMERDLMSKDGRSCTYRGRDGSELELSLIALEGRPASTVLSPLETTLRTLVAPPQMAERRGRGFSASIASNQGEDQASVRLPGLSVEADGQRAKVRMLGLTVDADDRSAAINISGGDEGTVTVNANDGGAEVRTRKETSSGLRTRYLLAQEEPGASGWNVVGYEARGPVGGPLVVATVRVRDKRGNRDGDEAFDEADDLLDRNVGR